MQLKITAVGVLIALGIIILWQNTANVIVSFLLWHFSLPKIFLILGVFLIGLVSGFCIGRKS